jgi:hypothetical protein
MESALYIGRQLSHYTYERASGAVEPVALVDSTSFVVDTARIGRWNTNIMQEEGRAKFLAVVEEIKANGLAIYISPHYQ